MDVMEAIKNRRAIKHFDPEHKIGDEEIEKLFEAVKLAPTAFNIQNWRFVLLKDKELRKRVRSVAWDQAQVTDASLLVVLCGDVKAWEKDPERYWPDVPQEIKDFIIPAIDQYYRGREWVQRDECMRSCGIAAQTIMLAAAAMGYDSCPMDGFDYEKVGELIGLPDDHVVTMFVAVGKGIQEAWPRTGKLPMDDIVFVDHF